MRRASAAALAAAVLAIPLAADGSAGRFARWHFVYDGGLEVSILFRRSAAGDETRLLVRGKGGRFQLVSAQDAASRTSEESIRSLELSETFARRLVLTGADTEASCAGVRAPDACVVFRGKHGSLAAGLSAFAGDKAPDLRARAAALPSAAMRRRLFALAPILPVSQELSVYGPDFLALVWPDVFGAPKALARGTRTPGCDFDAAFGFPCSTAERAGEAKRFGPPAP